MYNDDEDWAYDDEELSFNDYISTDDEDDEQVVDDFHSDFEE